MQAFEMRPKIEIGALNLPGVVFANPVLRGGNDFRIALSIICIVVPDRKDGELIKQLCEHVICAFPDLRGQDAPTGPIKGIPCPALIGLLFHKTPTLIGFDAYLDVKFM